jgi:hypothetical protein
MRVQGCSASSSTTFGPLAGLLAAAIGQPVSAQSDRQLSFRRRVVGRLVAKHRGQLDRGRRQMDRPGRRRVRQAHQPRRGADRYPMGRRDQRTSYRPERDDASALSQGSRGQDAPWVSPRAKTQAFVSTKHGRLITASRSPTCVRPCSEPGRNKQAAEIVRSLVDQIELMLVIRNAKKTPTVSLYGRLAGILARVTKASAPLDESDAPMRVTKLVAGARNHRQFTISVEV